MARIVFSGMIAGVPGHGGATWSVLQYVLGFQRLGHDVLFVEPVKELTSATVAYFRAVVQKYALEECAALLVDGKDETVGTSYSSVRKRAREADVLVNVSGMLRDPVLTDPIATRVYLDLDPVFNQLWHEDGVDVGFADHTHFVTVGLAVGSEGCAVPTCGREWIPTAQPVVLEHWPLADQIEYDGFTSVANWRGYGSIERSGVFYGQKAHSIRALIALPTMTDEPIMLGLAIHPDERMDLAALHENRWRLLDPLEVAGTPARYQQFIQGSKAELGVAKHGYVVARSGWFSDRSVCYLASGRPVLAQDTGFTRFLPTGDGLLGFSSLDEALAGVETIAGNYVRQARAARAIAEAHFASDRVLGRLLERL